MTTRYVVLPELRMPFEDRKALSTVLGFIGDYRPDCVIQLGHLVNLPPLGRFAGQATTELRRRELAHTADYVRRHYLSRLRQVHNGPLKIICSAASARLGAALHRKAAPDKAKATMSVERLVELDGDDAIELSTTYTLASGWTLLYGDNIAVADSDVPGNSAMKIARHLGVSVIVGHTMRLGKTSYTVTSADGATHTVTGLEIGHLIDQRHAKKMNGPSRGWQHGFAIIETHDAHVSAACIPLSTNRGTVRWPGRPLTGDATAPPSHPDTAHAPDTSAGGLAVGSPAPAHPTTPATSAAATVGQSQDSPEVNRGSATRPDTGTRVGGTATQRALVGVDQRSANGAWWQ